MKMTDQQWQAVVTAWGLTDELGAACGMTTEETAAHRQALRDAMEIGLPTFCEMVDRELRAAAQRPTLTAAERLRLDARAAIAITMRDFRETSLLALYEGPTH
jgi:hypothetical protein